MNTLGSILTIDLTARTSTIEPVEDAVARRYLGGRGFNIWQMREHVGPAVDPLGPENMLLLTCGLMTGTDFPASSRLQFAARSPQTNLLGASNVGGHFGSALRNVGYHMVRVVGRADRPVYIWIDSNGVEIRDASDLWGQSPLATAESIKRDQEDALVMAIGPGGENLVRFACVLTCDAHAAGRTGMGTVMGSKQLKAIAVARPRPQRNGRNGHAANLVREYALSIRQSERYDLYATFSNAAYMHWTHDTGLLGTRNFQTVHFEQVDKLDGTLFSRYVTRQKSCHRCPVHCRAEVRIDHGRYATMVGERPDIEPLMGFGPRIGVDDPEAVMALYNLSNELGIDLISTAGVLAFAADLYERGIITQADTGGLELAWGNVDAMMVLMEQIARQEGFGRVLAHGVRDAGKLIGNGAEQYAYHSKGLELPGYDPRGAQGTALGFAISNRGADYASVFPSLEFFWTPEQGRTMFGTEKSVDPRSPAGKGALVRYAYIVSAVLDALGICKVPVLSVLGDFSLEEEAELTSALTGWDITSADLFEIGDRIVTGERLLNLSYGMTYRDDTLPDMFLKMPLDAGPAKGNTVALEQMVQEFYAVMGWDAEGVPGPGCDV